mgnify:CR=1 FL=1
MYPLKTGSVGSLPSELDRNLVAAAATAEAVAITAEAGEQQDPDNPVAASVVSAAENATAIVAKSVVSATEEQQQDNPDTAVTSIVVLCASTSAGIVTSAVGSSQITHFSASKMFVLWFIVCTPACQCFIQNACINSDMY